MRNFRNCFIHEINKNKIDPGLQKTILRNCLISKIDVNKFPCNIFETMLCKRHKQTSFYNRHSQNI